jgi:hypothetical protein
MNFGCLHGESYAEYAASSCVGSHRLLDLRPYPMIYRMKHLTHELPDRVDTESLHFGRYLHTLALEGETAVDARYVQVPSDAPDRPTASMLKAKKPAPESIAKIEYWQKFDSELNGKEIISNEDRDLAWAMVRSIRAKKTACAMLEHGKPEVTFRHQLPSFPIQCRADWWDDRGAGHIIDVKSTESLEEFDRQFEKFNYFRQAAFYQLVIQKVMGLEAHPGFAYIVVEKQPPYQCAVRIPGEASLEIGAREVIADLKLLKQCYDSGEWPGEPDEARPVDLSEWRITKALAG